jgi:CheY-like chemotaxis protein
LDGKTPAKDRTILLVEDEADVSRLMQNCFSRHGYKLLCARNGQEALTVADQFDGRIHLIVTDIAMPQMDGTMLAQMMGQRRPETKVLFVSGFASQASSYFQENPTAQLIQKPFRLADLLCKVDQLAA